MNTSDWKKALKFATESAAVVLKGAYNPDHDILFASLASVLSRMLSMVIRLLLMD